METVHDVQELGVAPLAGSVDRNIPMFAAFCVRSVAPLAGSVDRNQTLVLGNTFPGVAPLAGSVDRNLSLIVWLILVYSRSPRGERG